MTVPTTVSAFFATAWHEFRRARYSLVTYEFLFKFAETWLFVPVVGMLLAAVLSRAGHTAVSNLDILDFLLTPSGLLYGAMLATIAMTYWLVEQTGVMVLAAMAEKKERSPLRQVPGMLARKSWPVVRLSAVLAAMLALAIVPFVLLAALTYRILLTEFDIYFYLKERPPVFWIAAGIGLLILLGALAVAAWLHVRWAFALPIVVFENHTPTAALRISRERASGAMRQIGLTLLGWLAGVLLIGATLEAGFQLVAATILRSVGDRVAVLLALLVVQATLAAVLSFVLVVGHGLILRRLYLFKSENPGVSHSAALVLTCLPQDPASQRNRHAAWLCILLVVLAPLAIWFNLLRYLPEHPMVRVTAHRGDARTAPENTIAAIRKAIESGADYAEVDVQLTADGVVVLLHDRDLKRVSNDSRRLDEMPYSEVRKLDVGTWFNAAFAGERVPTLDEAIEVCRGRIKMNIEMKFFGADRSLAGEVARVIREQHFESDCIATSLSYDALVELKRLNPRVRTGLIVSHAIGDLGKLDVDAFSVRADFLSDSLLRSAHRNDREVHVWTVNEPGQMMRMMKRGVDNLITSDPRLGVRIRDEWAALTKAERLTIASRLLIANSP